MKVLFLGDIVGRSGREAVCNALPGLRQKLDLDFVVANGENAAGGKLDMEIMADFVLQIEDAMKNIETMEKRYQKRIGERN